MLFNMDKSKVMHFGFNNKEVDYILGNQRLDAVEEESDVGVIVDKSLKSSRQCAKAAAAANAVLGMIRRTLRVFGVGRRTVGRGPGAAAAVSARPRRRPEVSPPAPTARWRPI